MATKHCDCRSKRPRSEANACPWHHAFIDDCMFAGLISFIGVASITRLVSRESHKRPPKVPHEPTRCYCCFLSLICNILLCTAQELVCGRQPAIVSSTSPRAALEDPKDPWRGHEDGRAATCDGASGRPCCASRCQVPLRWLPLRHGPLELCTEPSRHK